MSHRHIKYIELSFFFDYYIPTGSTYNGLQSLQNQLFSMASISDWASSRHLKGRARNAEMQNKKGS